MSNYYWSILNGALLTVAVSLAALAVSIVLGLVGAAAKLSGNKPLVGLATVYTTVIRGIPELVLMLLVFYGGSIGINILLEMSGTGLTLDIEPFSAGVLTLGFIYGAYMTETFRGAILSIPCGQFEAAAAFGMRPVQAFVRITLPQMVRYALPGFANNWLVLIKATALISLIGLHEMTYGLLAVLFALALTGPWKWLQRIVGAYTFVIRGTPLLIQIYLICYGLGQLE